MFRFLTAGESHGPTLTAIVDGVPSGLALIADQIDTDLARRQKGYGRGGRMSIETDRVQISSGVRHGKTLGNPITLSIPNHDWKSWTERMSIEPIDHEIDDNSRVFIPRPGHADLSGGIKYRHEDMRNVLERASARETTTRVAVGAVAKRILQEIGVEIASHVVSIGNIDSKPMELSLNEIRERSEASPTRCLDPIAEKSMMEAIDLAKQNGDTLGGIFEIVVTGLPVGIGSYVQWDLRLDGQLAQSIMSIPAIKGVEIGMGFEAARLPGSQVHDEIGYEQDFFRYTNNAGGIEGGITNGMPVVIRAAMKPIPTLIRQLRSVDTRTKELAPAHAERSDVCAVPAAAVVGEAMTAITIVSAMLAKFGGDSMNELLINIKAYSTGEEVK